MKTFNCDACGNLVFFENVSCLKCNHALGFFPHALELIALEPAGTLWRPVAATSPNSHYRPCGNGSGHQVCNWLVRADDENHLCVSCRLNQTIPDLTVPGNPERWFKMEQAKRRLIYSLLKLGLGFESDSRKHCAPLRFSFVADNPGAAAVLTGHSNGLITLNIAEADDAEREHRRVSLHEPYRTLLGHFRHEIGHYYWDRLIRNTPAVERFRELFGDERTDYAAALKRHYAQGPSTGWQTTMISAYAGAHPWEDWAETWAHYLHLVDTLETAAGFGIRLAPLHPSANTMQARPTDATAVEVDFDQLMRDWIPLTHALNSLNRGMGLPDLYPFVLSVPAVNKLKFVHETIRSARGSENSVFDPID